MIADRAKDRPATRNTRVELRPILLREDEAAAVLAIGQRTLNRLVADGTLPVVHVGRARRWRLRDLEKYAEQLDGEGAA